MRKAQYEDNFIQALSEFMQSYNDETMRVYERTKGAARRKLITTQDIECVVKLVDGYEFENRLQPVGRLSAMLAIQRSRQRKNQEQTGETE